MATDWGTLDAGICARRCDGPSTALAILRRPLLPARLELGHELDEAGRIAREIYEAGADALIIQDMGLLELDLPPIPLFASTQAHNFELERIRFLEQVGFRRVILARELTLNEIEAVRRATTLELECFVAGSLCVSLSGQCYFSQAVKGRSANRGECAQMCRLPYSLVDEQGNMIARHRHLLSLKDLDLSAHLGELVGDVLLTARRRDRCIDVGAGDTGTVRDASVYVKLVDRSKRSRHQFAIQADIRRRLDDLTARAQLELLTRWGERPLMSEFLRTFLAVPASGEVTYIWSPSADEVESVASRLPGRTLLAFEGSSKVRSRLPPVSTVSGLSKIAKRSPARWQ